MVNPNISGKYFPDPSSSGFGYENVFPKAKSDTTFRILALGGSTTAGFPYFYNGSFPALFKQSLQKKYSGKKFELINLGMSAISSMNVRDMSGEIDKILPDLVVIYCGHNEFYGVYGAAWGLPFFNTISLKRIHLYLKQYRLFQLVEDLVVKRESHTATTLMESLASGKYFPIDDPIRKRVYDQFEKNLNAILHNISRSDTPVFLCTIASNLSGQKPFKGVDNKASLDAFLNAENALKNEHYNEALSLFIQSRDIDKIPFRAPSIINEIIRKAAPSNSAILVDIESELHHISRDGIPGNNLFLEHVHPKEQGNLEIAKILMAHVDSLFSFQQRKQSDNTAPYPLITPIDRIAAQIQIRILKDNPPFTQNSGLHLSSITYENEVERSALKLLKGQFNYFTAHSHISKYYMENNDFDAAILECQALVEAIPYQPAVYQLLINTSIKEKKFDIANRYTHQLLALYPGDAFGNKWAGILALHDNFPKKAESFLIKAKRLKDDDQIRYNLCGAYLLQKKFDMANSEVKSLLKRNPDFPGVMALNNQIESLLKSKTPYK